MQPANLETCEPRSVMLTFLDQWQAENKNAFRQAEHSPWGRQTRWLWSQSHTSAAAPGPIGVRMGPPSILAPGRFSVLLAHLSNRPSSSLWVPLTPSLQPQPLYKPRVDSSLAGEHWVPCPGCMSLGQLSIAYFCNDKLTPGLHPANPVCGLSLCCRSWPRVATKRRNGCTKPTLGLP